MAEAAGDDVSGASGLVRALGEFAQLVAGDHRPSDVLDAVSDLCADLLGVHGTGVLLRENGRLAVGAASSPEGRAVEELEAELGEGPCTDAVRDAVQVLAPDLERLVDRYPRFVPRALEAGIGGIHALPMSARTGLVGALDVVTREPRQLTQDQLNVGQLLADVAVAYVANSLARERTTRRALQLQHALDSRIVIEQAKGRLAERIGEPVDQAFERMRRYARQHQLELRAVAQQVLEDELEL